MFVNRFERNDTLPVAAESAVVLADGIASQHPEYRHGDLVSGTLCRHIGVKSARVISLVPVPSPEGVSIGAVLILAICGCDNIVFPVQVFEGMCINKPGSHRLRIIAENGKEIAHVNIRKPFTFFRSIPCCKSDVCMPVPGIASPPGQPGFLRHGLRDFPPGANFKQSCRKIFKKLLVARVDQGIVLKKKSSSKIVLLHQLNLPYYRLIQHLLRNFCIPWFQEPYEVDYVYNFRAVSVAVPGLLCKGGLPCYCSGQYEYGNGDQDLLHFFCQVS